MALMTYLTRDRNGTYSFRRVIPPALRPFMAAPLTGKANFVRSLRTKEPAKAKVNAATALRDCTIAFQSAERAKSGQAHVSHPPQRGGVLPPHEDIEADVIAQMLAEDEAAREHGDDRRYLQTPEERRQWPDLEPVAFGQKGMAEDVHFALGHQLEQEALEFRRANARNDTGIIDAELRIYLRRKGVRIDRRTEDYRAAGLAMLRGKVRGYALLNARQAGDIVAAPSPPTVTHKGPKLSEALRAWAKGGNTKGAKAPGRSAVLEATRGFNRFMEWHGDLRLGNIDKPKAREFRDALARVRTRLPHDVAKLPLRDLLRRDMGHLPAVHANTINKSMNLLSAVIAHAMREGEMDKVPSYVNPFQGIKLSVDDRNEEGRAPFDAADLRSIFATKVYSEGSRPKAGGGEAAFWLPLIALLSGARQGELAQLRVEDLRRDPESGIWLFEIGTSGGRTMKTASSRRMVPVHPHLETVGLLRYRQSIIDAGGKDLWPDVVAERDGPRGGPWSKWFGRYLRQEAKVSDRDKVFHSFRHSFKRSARDAGLPEEVHDALTGHSAGGSVGRTYGRGFGLKVLAGAMGRIEVPEAVKGLVWKAAS